MKTSLLVATALFMSFHVQADTKLAQSTVLQKIHLINQTEIKLAKLGETKACRQDVKDFAYKLDGDHGKTDEALTDFAKLQDLRLPLMAVPDLWEAGNFTKMFAAEAELKLINSCDFDKKFLVDMKTGHLFAIELSEKAIEHLGKTDGTAVFVQTRILPGLRMHYQTALKLLSKSE